MSAAMSGGLKRSVERVLTGRPLASAAMLLMLALAGGCSLILDFDEERVSEDECAIGEPNQTQETASPILEESPERAIAAAICRPDIDFYSLAVATGQVVTIVELFFEQRGAQGDLDLRLYSASGVMVATSMPRDGGERIICPGSGCESLPAGNYVIEVRERLTSTTGNHYTLETRKQ